MPWLLDGNNLAGGRDREAVRRAALDLSRRERIRIQVFFDGAPPPGTGAVERLGPVEVRYVGHADAAIVAFLRGRGRGWRVASDDRELGRRVRAEGAEVVTAAAFWERIAALAGDADGRSQAETARDPAQATERLPDGPVRVRVRPGRRRPR